MFQDVVTAKGTKVRECSIEKTGIEVRHCANQRCNTDFIAVCHMQGQIVLLNVLYYTM